MHGDVNSRFKSSITLYRVTRLNYVYDSGCLDPDISNRTISSNSTAGNTFMHTDALVECHRAKRYTTA